MEDGEVEVSDQGLLPNPKSSRSSNIQASASIDSCLDDFLKSSITCTHTHTCNPPGPDVAHTHTCHHSHTVVFASGEDDAPQGEEFRVANPRRPMGNREAVRKYREKKKAHVAYLEEEVKKLRLVNQQLISKVQGQAILEAEVLRLRGLLQELRGKIDNELGVFPFRAKCSAIANCKEGDCRVQSNGNAIGLGFENNTSSFDPHVGASLQAGSVHGNGKMIFSLEENRGPTVTSCQANAIDVVSAAGCTVDVVETLVSSTSQGQ